MTTALSTDHALAAFGKWIMTRALQSPPELAPRLFDRSLLFSGLRGRPEHEQKRRWLLTHHASELIQEEQKELPTNRPPLEFLEGANVTHHRTDANGTSFELHLNSELGIGPNVQTLLAGIDDAKNITVRFGDSLGGDLYAGFELYNKLQPRDPTIVIESICASAAVVVAMSGSRRIMHKSARMMCHSANMLTLGTPSMLRRRADELELLNERQIQIVGERTGLSASIVRSWYRADKDFWFTAPEALELGLITEIE